MARTERSAQVTTDHELIKRWVEDHGGHPAKVKGTGGKDDVGMLRIDFDDPLPDTKLQSISWEDFFQKFDESDLAFLYRSLGPEDRFNKLVRRGSQETQH